MEVYFPLIAGLVGLIVGSFLNVLILRLPVMMHRSWKEQCKALFETQSTTPIPDLHTPGVYNLITPNSHCPHCHRPIKPWENIPILSYIFLKGRCKACKHRISVRYPLIEGLTAMLTVITCLHFGWQWQSVFAVVLTWALIANSIIDLDHQLLPDDITLPMLWLGLLLSLFPIFQSPREAILGAIVGYLSLWWVYWVFKLLTGKEGMGQGDFKLLAMLGAWMGWQSLVLVIFLSAFSGALVGVSLILFKKHDRHQPIPFGPFIALAGWITLLWGDKLTHSYLRIVGL